MSALPVSRIIDGRATAHVLLPVNGEMVAHPGHWLPDSDTDTAVRRLARPVVASTFFRGQCGRAELQPLFLEYVTELAALPEGACRAVSILRRKYQTKLDALTIFAH